MARMKKYTAAKTPYVGLDIPVGERVVTIVREVAVQRGCALSGEFWVVNRDSDRLDWQPIPARAIADALRRRKT